MKSQIEHIEYRNPLLFRLLRQCPILRSLRFTLFDLRGDVCRCLFLSGKFQLYRLQSLFALLQLFQPGAIQRVPLLQTCVIFFKRFRVKCISVYFQTFTKSRFQFLQLLRHRFAFRVQMCRFASHHLIGFIQLVVLLFTYLQ